MRCHAYEGESVLNSKFANRSNRKNCSTQHIGTLSILHLYCYFLHFHKHTANVQNVLFIRFIHLESNRLFVCICALSTLRCFINGVGCIFMCRFHVVCVFQTIQMRRLPISAHFYRPKISGAHKCAQAKFCSNCHLHCHKMKHTENSQAHREY